MLLRLYHLIPQSIRLLFYRLLLPIGEHLCGKGTYHVPNVQRLSFNLYLKRFRLLRAQYEAYALKMVAKNTQQ
ncbi:phosphotransferase family protein [Histoplasma ohiense]|nr:phosphotransferase family protein [Histoplasma ohiense (nom. inval.)]